jgi:hypothetical protein
MIGAVFSEEPVLSSLRPQALSILSVLFAASCLSSGGTSSQRACRGIEPNGPDTNGTAIRGQVAPSCPVRDDLRLRVVRLAEGITLASGESLSGGAVKWDAGAIVASGKQPSDFVGATLRGMAEPNQTVQVRIDAVSAGDSAPSYQLSYRWPSDDKWQPLCKDGSSAIAVSGEWDVSVSPGGGGKRSSSQSDVTFACQGSAIAKCVTLLKYKPWATTASGVSLDLLHQSCVRAVRADYCGNGQSNTRPNEQVNFYDSAGVAQDGAEWPLEAIWTPEGARCVEATRLATIPMDTRSQRPSETVKDYLQRTCPQVLRPCSGVTASDGTLLYTEVAPSKP